jgi:hypothetical protein
MAAFQTRKAVGRGAEDWSKPMNLVRRGKSWMRHTGPRLAGSGLAYDPSGRGASTFG